MEQGYYQPVSLNEEGFIHACKKEQVKGVLERYYKNQANLLLLHIDENKLTSELKYELTSPVNEAFPHIYGTLNLNVVVKKTTI